MSWILVAGALFCGWAMLRTMGGERERQLREAAPPVPPPDAPPPPSTAKPVSSKRPATRKQPQR
jgi:hypothetical protein